MDVMFDMCLAEGYKNPSQKVRRLTEGWTKKNMFCPRCGCETLEQCDNNKPVADFYCPSCNNLFELKSKNGELGGKITDGAYDTMIERITSNTNPDFFFMSYSKKECRVDSFMVVPKYFFVPDIIQKRKPLAESARRAGWVGCLIYLTV